MKIVSSTPIAVVGTGSFALDVLDWCHAAGVEVVTLLEAIDSSRAGSIIHGLPVAGVHDAAWGHLGAVIAVNADRGRLAAQLHGRPPAVVVHPTADVGTGVELQTGAVVGPGTVIGAAATIGTHTLLNRGCLVGHHTIIEEAAVLNPGANIGGNTSIGPRTVVGMGAVVVNGVTVGPDAIVAAGAVVIRDVPPGTRVQGIPARPFGEDP